MLIVAEGHALRANHHTYQPGDEAPVGEHLPPAQAAEYVALGVLVEVREVMRRAPRLSATPRSSAGKRKGRPADAPATPAPAAGG